MMSMAEFLDITINSKLNYDNKINQWEDRAPNSSKGW